MVKKINIKSVPKNKKGGALPPPADDDDDAEIDLSDADADADAELELYAADDDDNKEFDRKKFLKLLSNKFPSEYMKSKYKTFDETTAKFNKSGGAGTGTGTTSSATSESSDDTPIQSRSKPKIFITMTAATLDDADDSTYVASDSDNDNIPDNITVSSVSSVSDLSDISDISDDDADATAAAVAATTDKNRAIYARLKTEYKKDPKNRTLKKMAVVCKKELKQAERIAVKYEKKQREHNKHVFTHIISNNVEYNDIGYFKKTAVTEQKALIKEAKAIAQFTKLDKPYRITLIESAIPVKNKAQALKRINLMESSDPGSNEYNKNQQWVDNFMRIPFNKYAPAPFESDNPAAVADFIVGAKKTLDDVMYGMNEAKLQIMQMIGQFIVNPASLGTAIGICGPPGVGKSTLIKEGVSKILGRPFAMITLGGANDGSYLEGHSYTYEGSTWGRIVQILIDNKCMNPIIYFGELDKLSGTPRGDEIAGILTHLTDTTQNMEFHDKYFADVDFDLSRAMFIFDYNDESAVNPILRDRLYKIYAKEYTTDEKQVIAARYLVPRICTEMKFDAGDVVIPARTVTHIIDGFCSGEKGVRNLKRALETIYRKLNLIRLMCAGDKPPDPGVFGKHLDLGNVPVKFPFTVTPDIVNKLLDRPTSSVAHLMMYT